jgi:hypothetical protein
VLAGAVGRYVAQIADDDLWFPDHLAELEILLSKADFGNLLHVYLHPDGRVELLPGDIGRPETRRRMLTEKFNLFGPTVAGYRLEAYRWLPEGWTPAPIDVWSDLHMWRKFLRMERFVFATRAEVTAVVFAAPLRPSATLEQRHDENRTYWERIRDPGMRAEIVQAAWHSLLDRDLEREGQLIALASARDELAAELANKVALIAAKDNEIKRILQSSSSWLTAAMSRISASISRFDGTRSGKP